MELRGFDHYEVTLGDAMRGERASLGKTLTGAERDLRIKAALLEAIEDCRADVFPNPSVVSGYVRSYARYLGMDPDEVHARFCEASGFVPPNARLAGRATATGATSTPKAQPSWTASPLEQSRFANRSGRARFAPSVSLGALVSTAALLAVIAGVGYGGYTLVQNIQRVGFEPLPQAPEVVAQAPIISEPKVDLAAPRPAADAYAANGALARTLGAADAPLLSLRDGPISSIDPAHYGAFAAAVPSPRVDEPAQRPIDSADDAIIAAFFAETSAERHIAGATPHTAAQRVAADMSQPVGAHRAGFPSQDASGVEIHVTDTAWLRVRSGERTVVFEGILKPGESYRLPDRLAGAELRAGNAGAVYVLMGGTAFGPMGAPGQVIKNVSLDSGALRERLPQVARETVIAAPAADESIERRAEVNTAE